MSKRWLDDGAPAGVRDLLSGARGPRGMRADERARSVARLRRATLVPLAAGLGLWMKGGLLAAGLALASTSVAWVVTGGTTEGIEGVASLGSTAPRARSTETRPESVAPVPAPMPTFARTSAPAPLQVPRAPLSPSPTAAPSPRPVGEPPSLAAEAALLERARGLLASAPASALAATDEHRSTFPAGQLGPERELIAIDALTRLGRRDAAARRAEPLLRQPGLYHDRATRILGAP